MANTTNEKKTRADGAKRVEFYLAPTTLKKLDRHAKRVKTSRAQLLRDLVQNFVKGK